MRATTQTDTKVGANDPLYRTLVQFMWERQRTRIKVTLGITGLSRPIVHIDGVVWHLDVGSSHPGGGAPSKGSAVRRLKWYASWVQNVVRQFGLYPAWSLGILRRSAPSTRGPGWTNLWCIGCSHLLHCRVAMFGRDKRWKHIKREAHFKIRIPYEIPERWSGW